MTPEPHNPNSTRPVGFPGLPPRGTDVHFKRSPETSGKAIASLVFSIIGMTSCPGVCHIIGLVLGYEARKEIRFSRGRLTGEGFATAGIIIGWIGVAPIALGIIILIFFLAVTVAAKMG